MTVCACLTETLSYTHTRTHANTHINTLSFTNYNTHTLTYINTFLPFSLLHTRAREHDLILMWVLFFQLISTRNMHCQFCKLIHYYQPLLVAILCLVTFKILRTGGTPGNFLIPSTLRIENMEALY